MWALLQHRGFPWELNQLQLTRSSCKDLLLLLLSFSWTDNSLIITSSVLHPSLKIGQFFFFFFALGFAIPQSSNESPHESAATPRQIIASCKRQLYWPGWPDFWKISNSWSQTKICFFSDRKTKNPAGSLHTSQSNLHWYYQVTVYTITPFYLNQ